LVRPNWPNYMKTLPDDIELPSSPGCNSQTGPTFLIYFHTVVCCVSLIYVADFYQNLRMVLFDREHIYNAALIVTPFALASALFTFSTFSFGYVLGFYFYTMTLGYLWLSQYSQFGYDHALAAFSSFTSALVFLVIALCITSPAKQRLVLSLRSLDRLLSGILVFSTAILTIGAFYNFRIVSVTDIYNFRNELSFPTWLAYAMGIVSNALLPFAFACFVARRARWRAATVLCLLLLFYPITLSKLSLFATPWLLFLLILSSITQARTAVVLSLLLPISVGVLLAFLFQIGLLSFDLIRLYFGVLNFRMLAVPSSALDFYYDFFSRHELTYFCQITFLKPLLECPYNEQLSLVMEKTYHLGNFNASLFATEGIASVGPVLAPLSAAVCGIVIAVGNRLSSGLPSKFILLSSGSLPQSFLNVPLTTTLLTNGALCLFFLWYITPRTILEHDQ
jgi:hypothetical protein